MVSQSVQTVLKKVVPTKFAARTFRSLVKVEREKKKKKKKKKSNNNKKREQRGGESERTAAKNLQNSTKHYTQKKDAPIVVTTVNENIDAEANDHLSSYTGGSKNATVGFASRSRVNSVSL